MFMLMGLARRRRGNIPFTGTNIRLGLGFELVHVVFDRAQTIASCRIHDSGMCSATGPTASSLTITAGKARPVHLGLRPGRRLDPAPRPDRRRRIDAPPVPLPSIAARERGLPS